MRTPLVVVTGVDPQAMDSVVVGLSWDLPRAVSVRHRIDAEAETLTRYVSDATGVLEKVDIPVGECCVTCATRDDVVLTLERLARDDRWGSIVLCLPIGFEADQIEKVLARDPRLARLLRVTSVVAALGAARLVDDLLGDDLLRERGLQSSAHDGRGVGEVACSQVENADVLVVDDHPGDEAVDLARALAQPQSSVILGADQLAAPQLVESRRSHKRASGWCSPLLGADIPPLVDSRAWRLDLSSDRPFHPERLLDHIERLGGGPHRSRGSFWLPTRPGSVLHWAGSGGQLSIGTWGDWGRMTPRTRLLMTGTGPQPNELVAAFDELLLTPEEAAHTSWDAFEDGFEPWLGDIRDVA